MNKNKEG